MPVCPICKETHIKFLFQVYDDRFGFPGLFGLYRCAQCRHIFQIPPEEVAKNNQIYTEYYPRGTCDLEAFQPKSFAKGFLSWLKGEASAPVKWVPGGVRVLDVGCGFGETLAYLESHGCEAHGVELDENVRQVKEKFHFDIHIGPFDPSNYPPGHFDYVIMQQVIEHLGDPVETLKGVGRILKPGGHLVFSSPNADGWGVKVFGRRWINWHVPYHRHFFSRVSMTIAAENAGFSVVLGKTITSSDWLRYQWVHLISFPEMGCPSSFWTPNVPRKLGTKIAQQCLDLLHHSRLNHLITRFFDGVGTGDNLLVVLKKTL